MAKLCVRIKPNDHPTDATLTPLRTQPGDVVCIMGDSHIFSEAERNCGHYRFINVSGIGEDELANLVQTVNDSDGMIIKRRGFRLDPAILNNVTWSGKTTATKTEIGLITIAVP